jgi:cytidylate kinase
VPVTKLVHLITVAGPAHCGKSALVRDLVNYLREQLGFTAIHCSRGYVFKLLALIALESATADRPATAFTAAELIAMAQARGACLVDGWVWLDGTRVDKCELDRHDVKAIVARFNEDPDGYQYTLELIHEQIAGLERQSAIDGRIRILVLDGRSVNEDFPDALAQFHLTVSVVNAAWRGRCSLQSIWRRNRIDRRTQYGPLPRRARPGVRVIGTNRKSKQQVFNRCLPFVQEALSDCGLPHRQLAECGSQG